MRRKNILVRSIGCLARRFRALQEEWLLPWWNKGGLAATPLWAFDIIVLIVKLCSTCTMVIVRVIVPPALKSLHGETVLITEAGHGLGRELATQFAELGATVVCWDSDERRTNAVVDEIRQKDGECFGFTIDITIRGQVEALVTHMKRQFLEVTMIVSNSGAVTFAPFSHLHPDTVAKVLEINFLAHFWIIQAFLPSMIERRSGHIIAINSSAGLIPCVDMIPYTAAKFGLRGLMESLTEELRLDTWTNNIHTTSVYLTTDLNEHCSLPKHRFTSLCSKMTPKEAAKVIIEGIRKNKKVISIPSFMKLLIDLHNLMPYRIRIIFADFFSFGHRGWFCFC